MNCIGAEEAHGTTQKLLTLRASTAQKCCWWWERAISMPLHWASSCSIPTSHNTSQSISLDSPNHRWERRMYLSWCTHVWKIGVILVVGVGSLQTQKNLDAQKEGIRKWVNGEAKWMPATGVLMEIRESEWPCWSTLEARSCSPRVQSRKN